MTAKRRDEALATRNRHETDEKTPDLQGSDTDIG